MTHASNVTGTVMPVADIGRIARERNLVFIVDAAQTAGCCPIDVKEMNIDLLAFQSRVVVRSFGNGRDLYS